MFAVFFDGAWEITLDTISEARDYVEAESAGDMKLWSMYKIYKMTLSVKRGMR